VVLVGTFLTESNETTVERNEGMILLLEVGVMAQDLLMLGVHEAVVFHPADGFLYVDYDLIDLTLRNDKDNLYTG